MKLPKSKNQFKELKRFLGNLPRKLAVSSFLSFLVLFIFFLSIGALVFYQKVILVQRLELESTQEAIRFKEEIYQDILDVWADKEQEFEAADFKNYPNLFNG